MQSIPGLLIEPTPRRTSPLPVLGLRSRWCEFGDGGGGPCLATGPPLRDLDRSTARIDQPGFVPASVIGKRTPAAPWRDRRALAYGNQDCDGILGLHNCQFAMRDGTRRVPAVLRGIAALLHFVATGKNRSGKAFDGQ